MTNDNWYRVGGIWEHYNTFDDRTRLTTITSKIAKYTPVSVADVGCGNGFITEAIPAISVTGYDNDINTLRIISRLSNGHRTYVQADITSPNVFVGYTPVDMIVITGVLYRQYLEGKEQIVLNNLNTLLKTNGVLLSCHIAPWLYIAIPYKRLEFEVFDYREYRQKLEIYRKEA